MEKEATDELERRQNEIYRGLTADACLRSGRTAILMTEKPITIAP
jgi:hypothetical protein